jgi:biofilm PGA synthesis N-glycosyltransferase PgaC
MNNLGPYPAAKLRGRRFDSLRTELKFVLITPARNEAQFIEGTIKSVLVQTLKPARWVIASDGSTDGTDEIVQKYLADHPWIELVRLPERRERHFAGKVSCFQAGYTRLADVDYDVIGNLDADVTFEPDYFEFLLAKFVENPQLGVAGTPFMEGGDTYNYRFASLEHVSGQVQMFRRSCFEEIGGYVPIRGGGIDWVAVTMARMMGWKTQTFLGKATHHHRPMGTAKVGSLCAAFNQGKQDYSLGGHPLWEILRAAFQTRHKPYMVRGACLFCGFFWAMITHKPKPVPQELVRFHQKEQMQRLKTLMQKTIGIRH